MVNGLRKVQAVKETIKQDINNHSILYRSLIINASVLFFFILFFYARLETRNDIFMKSLIEGTSDTGAGLSSIVFSNCFFGIIICLFQSMVSWIPWYTVIHYILCFSSLTIISYVILSRNPSKTGIIIVVVLETFVGYEVYCRVNYLKTAMLLISAAWILFMYCTVTVQRLSLKILAGACAVVSSLVSLWVFVLGSIFWIIFSVVYFVTNRNTRVWIKNELIFIVPIIAIAGIFAITDSHMYKGSYYLDLGKRYCSGLEKNIVCGYAPYDEMFGYRMGIESNTYGLLANGYCFDLKEETLKKISDISVQKREFETDNIMLFFRRVPISYLGQFSFYLLVAIWMLFMYFKVEHRGCYILLTVFTMLILTFPFFMYYGLNYSWMYVLFCIPAAVSSCFLLQGIQSTENRLIVVYFIIFMVFMYNRFSGAIYGAPGEDTFSEKTAEFEDDKEYFMDARGYLGAMSAWIVYPKGMSGCPGLKFTDGIYAIESDRYENTMGDIDFSKEFIGINIGKLEDIYGWESILPEGYERIGSAEEPDMDDEELDEEDPADEEPDDESADIEELNNEEMDDEKIDETNETDDDEEDK